MGDRGISIGLLLLAVAVAGAWMTQRGELEHYDGLVFWLGLAALLIAITGLVVLFSGRRPD